MSTTFRNVFGKACLTGAVGAITALVAWINRGWYDDLTASWALPVVWMVIGWIVFYVVFVWTWYKANTYVTRLTTQTNAIYGIVLVLILLYFVVAFSLHNTKWSRWIILIAALLLLYQTIRVWPANPILGVGTLFLTLWLAYQTIVMFQFSMTSP